MTRRFLTLTLAMFAIVISARELSAADRSPSTTQSSAPTDDAQAARSTLAAIWAFDDIAQLKSLCTAKTQEDQNALDAAIRLAQEVNKVYQAVDKRFGHDAARNLKAQVHKELAIFLHGTTVNITGKTAVVAKEKDNRWTLVREDGRWKYGMNDWVKRSGGGFGEFAIGLNF